MIKIEQKIIIHLSDEDVRSLKYICWMIQSCFDNPTHIPQSFFICHDNKSVQSKKVHELALKILEELNDFRKIDG